MTTMVIAGSGPDALAASIALAKAGVEVHVLERGSQVGGALWGASEFSPGYRTPGLHHDVRVDHSLIQKLCPDKRLPMLRGAVPVTTPGGTVPGCASGPSTQPGWAEHQAWVRSVRRGLRSVARNPAPPFAGQDSVWPLLRVGANLRWMGKDALSELLRRGPLSVQDALHEWPELNDGVRASLGLTALTGTWLGPRDPTTNGLGLLRASVGDEISDGSAPLVELLAAQAEASGVSIHLNAPLTAISMVEGRVDGVVSGGTRRACSAVLVGGHEDLLALLPAFAASSGVEHGWRHVRRRGCIAIVRLGLNAPIEREGERVQRIHTAEHLDVLERAHDAVKNHQLAAVTPLDARQWSESVEGLAPDGHHVLGVHVHGVPLAGDVTREAVLERALEGLDQAFPGTSSKVVCSQVLRPSDLESGCGLPGGHLWGAEMALDQLWVTRPFARFAQYTTPWEGVYITGIGNHPGSLALGSGGVHAARMMLGTL